MYFFFSFSASALTSRGFLAGLTLGVLTGFFLSHALDGSGRSSEDDDAEVGSEFVRWGAVDLVDRAMGRLSLPEAPLSSGPEGNGDVKLNFAPGFLAGHSIRRDSTGMKALGVIYLAACLGTGMKP